MTATPNPRPFRPFEGWARGIEARVETLFLRVRLRMRGTAAVLVEDREEDDIRLLVSVKTVEDDPERCISCDPFAA